MKPPGIAQVKICAISVKQYYREWELGLTSSAGNLMPRLMKMMIARVDTEGCVAKDDFTSSSSWPACSGAWRKLSQPAWCALENRSFHDSVWKFKCKLPVRFVSRREYIDST